jgi:hypothetical protein
MSTGGRHRHNQYATRGNCQLYTVHLIILDSISCYRDDQYLRRVYNPPNGTPATSPVTHLQARTFATWNIAVGLVRIFAAYHIHEPAWMHMQMLTCVIGLFHFGMEAFVYKTARPSGPWLAPVLVAAINLSWSIAQYGFYIR